MPQSLAIVDGKLRASDMDRLLYCDTMINLLPSSSLQCCCIVDEQDIVQSIEKPSNAKTYNDLARCFLPHLLNVILKQESLELMFLIVMMEFL